VGNGRAAAHNVGQSGVHLQYSVERSVRRTGPSTSNTKQAVHFHIYTKDVSQLQGGKLFGILNDSSLSPCGIRFMYSTHFYLRAGIAQSV
jgi:hypothetical protein